MFGQIKNIVMWALTYRCNMSCDYCFLRDRVKKWEELSDDECLKIAEFIARDKTWRPDAVWLTGGEPTIKSCLADIINILEKSGIRCVITSNGLCKESTLDKIISASPRGINISLESVVDEKNDYFRGSTQSVIDSIKLIAERKNSNTILGVSCVVSQHNVNELFQFAMNLKELGVEYLSINPLIGNCQSYQKEEISKLIESCKKIQSDLGMIIPSEFYFFMLDKHLSHNKLLLKCPSGDHYFFISPWGKCYPCSNEIWQNSSDKKELLYEFSNLNEALSHIQYAFHTDTLTTCSNCFGDRCIGCWKLYYDNVFTKVKHRK